MFKIGIEIESINRTGSFATVKFSLANVTFIPGTDPVTGVPIELPNWERFTTRTYRYPSSVSNDEIFLQLKNLAMEFGEPL